MPTQVRGPVSSHFSSQHTLPCWKKLTSEVKWVDFKANLNLSSIKWTENHLSQCQRCQENLSGEEPSLSVSQWAQTMDTNHEPSLIWWRTAKKNKKGAQHVQEWSVGKRRCWSGLICTCVYYIYIHKHIVYMYICKYIYIHYIYIHIYIYILYCIVYI